MRTLLFLVFLLVFVGCTRRVYVPQVRSERIVDTIRLTEPDSAMVTALFECDSLGRVRLREIELYKGREASQEFTFADNSLRIETRWRTQFIDRFHEIRDTLTVVETRTETRFVTKIPLFFWICFSICIGGILYIVYRIFFKK